MLGINQSPEVEPRQPDEGSLELCEGLNSGDSGRTYSRQEFTLLERAVDESILDAWVTSFDKSLAPHIECVTDAENASGTRKKTPHDILCLVASGVIRYLGFDEVTIGDEVSGYNAGQGDVIGLPGPIIVEAGGLRHI